MTTVNDDSDDVDQCIENNNDNDNSIVNKIYDCCIRCCWIMLR